MGEFCDVGGVVVNGVVFVVNMENVVCVIYCVSLFLFEYVFNFERCDMYFYGKDIVFLYSISNGVLEG